MSNTTTNQPTPAFNLESQKQLARLLAKENIMIRIGNYNTAFFDVQNRVLGLPSWNVADKNVADLLVGHEVGHALHTPVQAQAEYFKRFPNAPFDIANIVEDIRIERMIQESFPGLITPFRNGYKYFIENDFFKIAGKDLAKLNFLDRLNIKGKLRDQVQVPFTPEEQAIFDLCDQTKTWDDVLEACAVVIDYINTPKPDQSNGQGESNECGDEDEATMSESSDGDDHRPQPKPKTKVEDEKKSDDSETNDQAGNESKDDASGDDGESEDDSAGDSESSGDSDSDSDDDSQGEESDSTSKSQSDSTPSGQERKSKKPEGDKEKAKAQTTSAPDINTPSGRPEDFVSSTQNSFDDELNKLHADVDFSEVNKPILADFKNCINSIDKVREERRRKLNIYNSAMTDSFSNEKWESFKKSSKSTVALFAKEFERKKSAYEYSRATQATTGQINVNMLHAYKYDDQIFKTVSRLAQSKSHGMAFFLDCSGSMDYVMADVVKQTLELVWFCKAVNIPFIVYGFTSLGYNYDEVDFRIGDNIDFRNTTVNELLNHTLGKHEFETACKELFINYVTSSRKNAFGSRLESLGGTPLYETTIIAAHLVNAFREKTGVQKMNTIFISDGDGGSLQVVSDKRDAAFSKEHRSCSTKSSFVWCKKEIKFLSRNLDDKNVMVSNLMSDFKTLTGSSTLCFYLPTQGTQDMISKCTNAYISSEKFPKITTWREGFEAYETLVKGKRSDSERMAYIPGGFGFDGYFIMKDAGRGVKLEDSDFEVPNFDVDSRAGRNKLAKEFTKHTGNKKQSRVFLTKFMDLIC